MAKWLGPAILITGAVVLFAAVAAARGGDAGGGPPIEWHPELTDPLERAFVWNELQSRSGIDIFNRGDEYDHTTLSNGNKLSTQALAVLAAEAVLKMTAAERAANAP